MRLTLIISIVLFAVACQPKGEVQKNTEDFIDLNSWFDEQMADLAGRSLHKTSVWNEHDPIDSSYEPDWKTELQSFDAIPLTPSSWKTDFDLKKSERSDSVILELTPRADLNELRKARITIRGGEIQSVELRYEYENMLKRNHRELRYDAGKGYEISGVQKTRFFPEENYHIIGKFEAPKKQ